MENKAGATPLGDRSQRLHRFVGSLLRAVGDAGAGGVESVPVGCLSAAEATETVLELRQVISQLRGLELAVLAHADAIDASTCLSGAIAADTAGWLRNAARVSGPAARAQVTLSRELTGTYTATGSALLAGDVDADQAKVIVWALGLLPDWVSPEKRAEAEKLMLEESLRLDAAQLRVVGRRLLAVIDPDGAEAAEARRLLMEEEAAASRARLCFYDDRDGTTQISGTLPTRHAHIFRKALDAFANPDRPDPIARLNRQTSAVRGEACCRLLEHLDTAAMPTNGGTTPSVVVTMSLETLLGGLRPGTLETGLEVSAGEVRRMACDAGMIPAVLGGRGEVLDLGRTARLFSKAQRIAMAVRQGHRCAADGCDRPTSWAEAHHLDGWAAGGMTDLDRGVMICARHHTLAHHPDYIVDELPPGGIRISRRPRDHPRRQ